MYNLCLRVECLCLVISEEAECDDGEPHRGQHSGQLVISGGAQEGQAQVPRVHCPDQALPLPQGRGHGAVHMGLHGDQAAGDQGGQPCAHNQDNVRESRLFSITCNGSLSSDMS